jgi:hypothetical protein
MMRQALLIGLCAISAGADGQVIATCSEPEGYAHYHHSGLVPKRESGFQKDRISGGLTTLQQLENGELDVLIVDTRKQVISYRQINA